MDSKLDLSKYTTDDFKRFSIFELRDIAAFFGVKAPTAHPKAELVTLIEEARMSGLSYQDRLDEKKRGRPSKSAKMNYTDGSTSLYDSPLYDNLVLTENATSEYSVEAERPPVEIKEIQGRPRRNPFDLAEAKISLENGITKEVSGYLEINPKGFGFVRAKYFGFDPDKDAHIDPFQVNGLNLRNGDYIKGLGKKEYAGKSPTIIYVLEINGVSIDKHSKRKNFDELLPIFPNEKFTLELKEGRSDTSIRCIDLIAPIGKGQRALIVSPPKAGKTTLLKQIANSISKNNPETKMFVLLIDERPEEVTDMQRSIKADVIYSTFDEQPEHHIKMAEAVLESAKRYVESGKDAIIILDSLTRLARAYNSTVENSGRSLSGGLDPAALFAPKRFFGAARNIEDGGSLTIIATALIDTGSRLDDVIFEEFKGTGNMEIVLDRRLSERRIFPAIDLAKSGTRREDLLLTSEEITLANSIRSLLDMNNPEVLDTIINEIYSTKNNAEFMNKFSKKLQTLKTSGYSFTNGSKSNK